METPFALNSLPLRQRARWRVRSQVSWRKTCNASALYTIGIHAFFINLRNSIPCNAWIPAIRHARCQKLFLFPSLWQSKRKKPNFFAKNDSGKTLAEVTEKTLQDQRGRKEDLERITREYGTQLRMNRSIQADLLSKTEGLDKCAFSAVQVL